MQKPKKYIWDGRDTKRHSRETTGDKGVVESTAVYYIAIMIPAIHYLFEIFLYLSQVENIRDYKHTTKFYSICIVLPRVKDEHFIKAIHFL